MPTLLDRRRESGGESARAAPVAYLLSAAGSDIAGQAAGSEP